MGKYYLLFFLLLTISVSAQQTVKTSESLLNPEIEGLKIYPNPAPDDFVYITTDTNTTKGVVIYDVFGKAVLTDRVGTSSPLNITRLVPGVYMIQVTEGQKTSSRKLVVK